MQLLFSEILDYPGQFQTLNLGVVNESSIVDFQLLLIVSIDFNNFPLRLA